MVSSRPDSTVLTHLVGVAEGRRYEVSCKVEDVSLELDLPPTWEEYLGILNRKQRHEVRRKLRRLWETGEVNYRIIEGSEAVPDAIDLFLKLFRESNKDKEIFMTANRESFYRSPAKAMAQVRQYSSLSIGLISEILCIKIASREAGENSTS